MPPLPFGKELDLQLIKLVEMSPILYDTTHENYTESVKREQIWQSISEVLNRSPRDCKTRWINIRDNLRRNLKSKTSKSSNYKYKYENDLKFLVPFFRHTVVPTDSAESNDDNTSIDAENYETITFEEPGVFDYEETNVKPDVLGLHSCGEASSSIVDLVPAKDECTSSETKRRSDPVDLFLETVGSTLKGLNPYYLNLAKSRIFQVVQDCELQQIINKGEVPTTESRT